MSGHAQSIHFTAVLHELQECRLLVREQFSFFSYLISIIVGCCKEIKWLYLKRKKFISFNESRVVITDHCGAS